jgi:hypothetical protein
VGPWPGIDEVLAVAQESSDELIALASALDEDVVVGLPWRGTVYRYPESFFLAHALEHGTEHRTEIRIGLEIVGAVAPELDGWALRPRLATERGRDLSHFSSRS